MIVLMLGASSNGMFRGCEELIGKLKEEKAMVYVAAPNKGEVNGLTRIGAKYIPFDYKAHSKNPFVDISLYKKYRKLIKRIRPAIVLTYTVKPNVYAGMVCKQLNIPYIANITGLGDAVENPGILRNITMFLTRIGLRKAEAVFFQNKSNLDFYVSKKVVSPNQAILIPGSGINLEKNIFEKYPIQDYNLKLIYIGRITKDKGASELFYCVKTIKDKYPFVTFIIIGKASLEYEEELMSLESQKYLTCVGYIESTKIHNYIKESHALIFPSYHEGMANVLLEAAACGRPVISSLACGCKETFDDNISGIGFEPKNKEAFIKAVEKFIKLPYEQKKCMGEKGRLKIEKEFDRVMVVDRYINVIERALVNKK